MWLINHRAGKKAIWPFIPSALRAEGQMLWIEGDHDPESEQWTLLGPRINEKFELRNVRVCFSSAVTKSFSKTNNAGTFKNDAIQINGWSFQRFRV